METRNPDINEFIRFCVKRRGKEWPALYDEMTWVAGRHLFRGWGHTELKEQGLSLCLDNMDTIVKIVEEINIENV